MKKLITLLLIVLTHFVFGQTIINFVDPEATWNVAKTFPNGNPENPYFIETTTKIYGYQGDTLINNELWLKMYVTQDSNFLTNLIFVGIIKENNGIVVFSDPINVIDTIYNFNLQTGDSVLYNWGFGSEYLSITSIDSVDINSTFHKRFYFNEPSFEPSYLGEYWIEGIGSIHGPLFPKYPVLFSQELPADSLFTTCYKIENNIIWNNPNYDSCYVNIVMSNNELPDNGLRVFPNPVKNELRIEIPTNEIGNYKITIVDLFGKIIISKIYEHRKTIEINTTSLKSTFYILQVDINNKIYRQKFIKQ